MARTLALVRERRPSGDLIQRADRLVREQGRRGELVIAWVRIATLALYATLDWIGFVWPSVLFNGHPVTLSFPLIPSVGLLGAAALTRALARGHYSVHLGVVMPVADALLLSIMSIDAIRVLGQEAFVNLGLADRVGLVAGLIASSGGMRFSRAAAVSSTAVGAVSYVAMAALFGQFWRAPFTVALILSFGMMGLWMSENARRVAESEVGRLALERFLPRRLVEGAHRDPANPLGPPRIAEVTVLVSDLRGFTAIAQGLDPAQVMALLNELQGDFARVIDEHGGTVDKFMGDGMLAVFGAIEPLVDHAGAAVAATRGLRETLVRLNATRAASSLPALSIGIGVHSGTVVAGCLGGGPRLEFTVIGDTVNVASRLETMTKEHSVDVLVSEETAKRLQTASEREALEPLGAISIRGRVGTMAVFALGSEAAPERAR